MKAFVIDKDRVALKTLFHENQSFCFNYASQHFVGEGASKTAFAMGKKYSNPPYSLCIEQW